MITISLCLIVRNEEENLERCLTSVQGIPDEIIIVDTGSTDSTKEIASKWTPHVYDFEWIDDFSAARNASFQYATQEYILWLDADDVLAPEERGKLMELKHSLPLTENVDVISMNYAMLQHDSPVIASQAMRLRVVKRNTGLTWRGFVHEDLTFDGPLRCLKTDITVTHRGKVKGSLEPPSRRNLEMYEKQLAKGYTFTVSEMYHYASECLIHKQYNQAIHYYEQCKKSPEMPLETKLGIMHKLATCYALSGQPDKEMELTLESFTLDTPYPAFSCRMAEYFLAQGLLEAAMDWYHTAYKTPLRSEQGWFYADIAFHTWLPHHQLALCYEALGYPDKARCHRERADAYLNPA